MNETKFTKSPVIVFIVIGCLLLLFGMFLNTWLDRLFKPPYWMFVCNFLPGPGLIGLAFTINKPGRYRKCFIISLSILTPVLCFIMVILTSRVGFYCSARPETDPSDYKDVLEILEYRRRPWLQHFPSSIPGNATNTSFYWGKGFLQADVFMQLRFVLPEAETKTLLNESLKKKTTIPAKLKNSNRDRPPFTPLMAGVKEFIGDWPDDFEIIVFHYGGLGCYMDEGYGTQEYWGEKFSYGIAISQCRNEVVYWTEEYPH